MNRSATEWWGVAPRLVVVLVVATFLALGGCDRSAPGIDGAIDGQKALAFLYGPYDTKLEGAVWKVANLPSGSPAGDVLTEGKDAIVGIALAQQVKEGDVDRFYLGVVITPQTEPGEDDFDCESCQPAVGATIFVKHGDRWQVEAHQPFVTKLGYNGGGPAMTLVAVGPSRHGILADTDWFNRGNSGAYVSLWTQEQGRLAERFATMTKEDNGGNCSETLADDLEPCRENVLDIKYEPGPVADHYDIHVRPNAAEWTYDNAGHQGEMLFRFDGTKYVAVEMRLAPAPVGAADRVPWAGPLPDSDPAALLAAYLRADAWGLQLSSENWPLVTRFTTWQDGPGWDTSAVVESAEIIGRRDLGKRAEVTVRVRKIGDLHGDGEMMPVLDTTTAGTVTRKFILENLGKNGEVHWKIVEPQDGPHLAVDYVLVDLIPAWCGKRDCRQTEAYRVLREHQDACPPSAIPLNRSCHKDGT